MQKGDMSKGGEAGEVAKDMKKFRCEKVCFYKTQGLVQKKKKRKLYKRSNFPNTQKAFRIYTLKLYRQVESIIPYKKKD